MTLPKIILIDDEPIVEQLTKGAEVCALRPQDSDFGTALQSTIQNADLVLLDHQLELPKELGLTASDGASFVGHLRSWARQEDAPLPPLVIYTSEDEAFTDETPVLGPAVPINGSFSGREPGLAPALDVEWLIYKFDEQAADKAIALAQDARKLRELAGDGRMSLTETVHYLAPPKDSPWYDMAAKEIGHWRPPISEIGEARVGARGTTATLRWLLNQVLPCPGLLISSHYAAWSLGVGLESFETAKDGNSEFANMLKQAFYEGPGHTLFPKRWWAAGIDFIGWELRDQSHKLGGYQKALDSMSDNGLTALPASEQVVVVDIDLQEQGLAPIAETVEINPPGWPAAAIRPWMRQDVVKAEPAAQSMIDPEDAAYLQ